MCRLICALRERSGRVLDSRPRGCGFKPHRRHCVEVLEQRHIYPSLVLVQPRKTRPCLTERLLMGHKESNQTNKWSVLLLFACNKIKFSKVQLRDSVIPTIWINGFPNKLTFKKEPCIPEVPMQKMVFVWFDSLRPINNLLVKQGRVFLGGTSTKLG